MSGLQVLSPTKERWRIAMFSESVLIRMSITVACEQKKSQTEMTIRG